MNGKRGQNFKYAPFAFTELGVAMLSSILNSKIAIEVNRTIMRTFVTIRRSLTTNSSITTDALQNQLQELKEYIEEVFTDYNDINDDTRMQIELINQSLAELQADNTELKRPRRRIGFDVDSLI